MRIVKRRLGKAINPMVVPLGTRVLAVGVQRGDECIWLEQDTNASAPGQEWVIYLFMTGDFLPSGRPLEHLGTHIGRDGNDADYVVHFYREVL